MRGDLESEGLELGQNSGDVDKIQDNTLPISTLFLLAVSDYINFSSFLLWITRDKTIRDNWSSD